MTIFFIVPSNFLDKDSKVYELAASDDNPASTLTFTLTSVTSDLLELRNGREIYVSSKGLDYESNTRISALVAVSDGELTVGVRLLKVYAN